MISKTNYIVKNKPNYYNYFATQYDHIMSLTKKKTREQYPHCGTLDVTSTDFTYSPNFNFLSATNKLTQDPSQTQ